MGAGASAPAGAGSSPAPVVAPPVSTPIAPVVTPTATPSSTPQGGKGGPTTAGGAPSVSPVTPSVSPVAPTAPQQPYVNPFMQTYGQNRTPQQQMFNRFQPPQQFRQPVAQPAQGPVYADQSLNAPGNQPQQFQQPQYGRFGQQRGFMNQNRGGYDRQLDQLRGQGQYGQQYPQKQLGFMSDLMSGQQQMPAYNGPTQAQFDQMRSQPATGYESAPSLGGQAPAGGKGGNPTVTGTQTNGSYDPGYM